MPCLDSCTHFDGQARGYHVNCLEFATAPSGAFLFATEYLFEPTPSEEQSRFDRIQYLLANRLEVMCTKLPLELRLIIAKDLVRECANITTQELWCTRPSSDAKIDILLGVWAHYVYIDGIRYVARLTNKEEVNCTKILDASKASKVRFMYVLQNHLGIRQVVFATSGAAKIPSYHSQKGGLQSKTIEIQSTKLKAKSDVSGLSSFTCLYLCV